MPRVGDFPRTLGSQMPRELNEEVAHCHKRAEECARKAECASCGEMREDFLLLKKSWVHLAQGYELAERLVDFSRDNQRRRVEFFDDGRPII